MALSAGFEPATFCFVVRFFERDAAGCGAKVRFLKVFAGMRPYPVPVSAPVNVVMRQLGE